MSTAILQRPVRSIWVELTGKCQLECVHCYAGSSPEGDHGDMTAEDWEKVLDDARALGARFVCFIGGEPTLNPDLPRLVRHALAIGMEAEVFSNLVAVSAATWELLRTPGVRLATSWYTDDREQHKAIAQRDTWRQTKANIAKAVMYGIPLRAGVIDGLVPGQRYSEGIALLREMGVTDIGGDHLREFGRGTTCDPTQGCGNCGAGRAAILPDGSVTPCPLTRWMKAGNVHEAPLGEHIEEVRSQASVIPNWRGHAYDSCVPNGNCGPDGPCVPKTADCMPICAPYCGPSTCKPSRSAVAGETSVGEVSPGCFPDACGPDIPCKPSVANAGDCAPEEACNPDDMGPRRVAAEDAICGPDFIGVCAPHCTPNKALAEDLCRPDFACGPAYACAPKDVMSVCPPDACYPDTHEDCSPYDCRPVKPVTACSPGDPCGPTVWCAPNSCMPRPAVAVTACSPCGPDCGPSDCRPSNESCRPDEMAITDDACRPDHVCGPSYCVPGNTLELDDDAPTTACRPCGPYSDCGPNLVCGPYQSCRPDWGAADEPALVMAGPDPDPEPEPKPEPETTCKPDFICGPNLVCGPHGMR
jgi:MoaA/NifB/PqqE/SkfB family radical SAM enzyme